MFSKGIELILQKKIQNESGNKAKNVVTTMPTLKGDEEEVKKETGFNVLTPNKILTRLPILLAQLKDWNK